MTSRRAATTTFVRPLAVAALATVLSSDSGWAFQAGAIRLEIPNDAGEIERRSRVGVRDRLLLRSATSMLDHGRTGFIAPAVFMVGNTMFPYSANDGALWAGRGGSALLRTGFAANAGRLRLVIAPEFHTTTNRPWLAFDIPTFYGPVKYPDRSIFSAPWYRLPRSIDMPWRFGPNHVSRAHFGQSSLMFSAGRARGAEVGIGTENQWWGPGLKNALLVSTNASGFPHVFARTARPVATRLGRIEARWLLGGLTESAFFDTISTNNTRAYSAAAVVWHAADSSRLSGLAAGIARAVIAPVSGWSKIPAHPFLVLSSTPRSQRVHDSDTLNFTSGRDQISTLFARWAIPGTGLEIHAELGRTELPVSLRDALLAPEHTLGRTLGMQWQHRLSKGHSWNFEAELTNIERSPSFASRQIGVWYASRAVPQGYTNRGEVIGAAIGPGASSQWLALDRLGRTWRVGLVGQRIRWNNDAFYYFPNYDVGRGYCEHDVTLAPGVRGAWRPRIGRFSFGHLSGELLLQNRMNFFFQNASGCPNGPFRRDLRNKHFVLGWSL